VRSIACLVSFLLLVAPGAARAGGPPSSVQPETVIVERKVERYGLQIVLADVLWVAATSAIGEVTEDGGGEGALSVLGLGFYATGPAVHLAHGNKSGALKSLGARALLPVGGALVGMALAGEDDDFDALGGMLLGFTAGAAEGSPARRQDPARRTRVVPGRFLLIPDLHDPSDQYRRIAGMLRRGSAAGTAVRACRLRPVLRPGRARSQERRDASALPCPWCASRPRP
jgi:hypothetical protein